MKFTAAIAAVATFAATANAAACPAGEALRLIGLAFEPSLIQCQNDSGYTFIPPPGPPSQEQVDKMCASTACPKTIAALQKLKPNDCDLTFSNGVTLNIKQLLDTLVPACDARRIHVNSACPPEETNKLIQLAFEPSLEQCQEDSGFFFIPPSGTPTDEQVNKMCASEACPKTIAALSALNPSDCDLTFSNGVTLNVKQLLDTLVPTCGFRR